MEACLGLSADDEEERCDLSPDDEDDTECLFELSPDDDTEDAD